MRNRLILISGMLLFFSAADSLGQVQSFPKDTIQNVFKAGKIVSLKDNVACYRLNGLQSQGAYGYCIYDTYYDSAFSLFGHAWDSEIGSVETCTNSKCYTVVAPVFDYAQPFSEGWGAVCKDKKWSYVSLDGTLMCDFILDAAYPFKNGSAKVIYKDKAYTIAKDGEGLPPEADRNMLASSRQLQMMTIRQLYSEHQYEKSLEKGIALYDNILRGNSELQDITAQDLLCAISAHSFAMASRNSLMSLSCLRFPDIFDGYQDVVIDCRISAESGHYELNNYNSQAYFKLLAQQYLSDDVVRQVCDLADERNYRSAIMLYENWLKDNSISVQESAIELMAYYYLAELSDDFELANRLLVSIAQLYENRGFDSIDDAYIQASLMLNIRKCKGALNGLLQVAEAANAKGDLLKEAVAHYNLAILYSLADDVQLGLFHYENAYSVIKRDVSNAIPPEMTAGIMADFIDFLLHNNRWTHKCCGLLDTYLQTEICYNTDIFTSSDILHTNRHWGKSLARIDKILQHLDKCHNKEYQWRALTLSIFKQSVATDTEKAFQTSMRNTKDEYLKSKISRYRQLKDGFIGYDLFNLSESNVSNKEAAAKISSLEREIKSKLLKKENLNMINMYLSPLSNLKEDEVVINVVEYKDNSAIHKYGVFLVKGNRYVEFVPLGKASRFSLDAFWPTILNDNSITAQDKCYLYAGKLAEHGLEYGSLENGEIAYFNYNVHRISSISVLNQQDEPISFNTIVLFGGLDYGEEFVAKHRGVVDNGYLEYSKIEVETIADILKDKAKAIVNSDEKGTVRAFLALQDSVPDVIHVATHGYQNDLNVIPWDSTESFNARDRFNYYRQNTEIENQEWLMNNTGLFLSLSENDNVNVISSREVASCEFSKTKLIVLSACSTQKGQNSDNYSENISLTTAFTISGVQNIITSINDVEDKMACEFMELFYRQLRDTDKIYESFSSTVAEMYRRYPSQKKYWTSFILLEN